MHVKILLPYQVFADVKNVKRMVVETTEGSYGFLPNRLDGIAVLVPGILQFETEENGLRYVAVEEGILVKAGNEVWVSVRNAVGDAPLEELRASVAAAFKRQAAQDVDNRSAMAKLESSFIRNVQRLWKDQ